MVADREALAVAMMVEGTAVVDDPLQLPPAEPVRLP
jgi:hypothetical protein